MNLAWLLCGEVAEYACRYYVTDAECECVADGTASI